MPPALIGVWPFKQLEIHPGVLARHPCPTLPQAAEAGTGVPRQQKRAGGSPVPWGTSPLPASVGAQAQGPVPSPGRPQPTPAGCPGTLGSPASPWPPDPRRLRTWGPHRQAREPGAKPRGGFPCQPLLGASMWKHSPQNRFLEQGPGALSLRRGRLQPRLPRAAPPGTNRGPFPLSGAGEDVSSPDLPLLALSVSFRHTSVFLPWDLSLSGGQRPGLQDRGPLPAMSLSPRASSILPPLAARTQLWVKTDFRALDVPEHLAPTSIWSVSFSWSQAWPRVHVPCRHSTPPAPSRPRPCACPPLARLSPGPCLDLAGLSRTIQLS